VYTDGKLYSDRIVYVIRCLSKFVKHLSTSSLSVST
jgi:hypothetical protein